MLEWVRLGLAALIFAGATTVPAAPAPAELPLLIWTQHNSPPFFLHAPTAGESFGGPLQQLLQEELPQFHHVTQVMPLKRLKQFWRNGANYCFVNMLHRPAPNATYRLSIPNVYYRPQGFIARRDNPAVARIKAAFPSGPEVYPLEAFFAASHINLGMISGRGFSVSVDALLARYQQRLNIFERADGEGLEGLFRMLKLGRVDYIIDHPFVFEYFDRQPDYHQELQFIPLAETLDQDIWGAVGCTNNNWGEDKIAAINQAIIRLMERPQYRDLVLLWHAAPGQQTVYWEKLRQKVLRFPSS